MFGLTSLLDPSAGYRKLALILGGVLLILVVGLGCLWMGYGWGYGRAEDKGKAEIKTLEASYAKASANATETARQTSEALARRGNDLAGQLIATRSELATARADINRRIHDVAQTVPAACVFGPDFVRWWNESAGIRADAQGAAPGPGGTAGRSGKAGSAGAGVRQDASVSLAAVMAHHRDLEAYARDLEATSSSRLKLLEAWAQ